MDKNTINQVTNVKKDNFVVIASGLTGVVLGIVCLYLFFPKGFNEQLGISLLLTLLLFSFVGTFVNFYSSVSSFSPGTNYQKIFYILGGILGLTVIPFGILTSLNVFKYSKPENYMDTIISYGATTLLLVFSGLIYFFTKNAPLNLPLNLKLLYEQRTKYSFLFLFYILSVASLYAFNPQDIMTKYGGVTMFFSLFIGIVMFSMVIIYNYYFNNLGSSSLSLENMPGWTFFLKSLYALFSVGISGGLIYFLLKQMGVLDQEQPKEAGHWVKIIVNTLLLVGMLSIIYKLINIGGYLEKSPLFNLILNVILYIPCILLSLFRTTAKNTQKTDPSELGLLLVTLGLFVGYFGLNFIPKAKTIYNKWKLGGKQFIGSDALPLNNVSNIAGYQELNGNDKFNYTYGMSFWFYLDSVPPSTNASYNKMTNILSYGDKPCIKYDAQNNSLYIFYKKEDGQEGEILVHKEKDVMLQKWNNVIINYNGGTLDVFYNGELVKSINEIVPYMKYDMLSIGSENGIYGGIKNLMYYKEPLDALTIQNIRTMQK